MSFIMNKDEKYKFITNTELWCGITSNNESALGSKRYSALMQILMKLPIDDLNKLELYSDSFDIFIPNGNETCRILPYLWLWEVDIPIRVIYLPENLEQLDNDIVVGKIAGVLALIFITYGGDYVDAINKKGFEVVRNNTLWRWKLYKEFEKSELYCKV